MPHQFGHFRHQFVVVETRAIPLQQGEFRIVAGAGLAVPEGPRQLVNGHAIARQQPFHRIFGRGLQVARLPHQRPSLHHQRLDNGVGHSRAAEQRCFNLEDIAGGEKMPQLLQQ